MILLNSGDLWISNFMFKYNDEKLENLDLKVVDYQLVFYNTFACDFFYAMYMLVAYNLTMNEEIFEQLLKIYHDNLVKNLQVLNYRRAIPSIDDLQKDLESSKFFGNYFMLM